LIANFLLVDSRHLADRGGVMNLRWLAGTAAVAGIALSPLGVAASSSAAASLSTGTIKVKIEGNKRPHFDRTTARVVGSTTCVPDQISIKNTTTRSVTLTPNGVIQPGKTVTGCFNPGAEGKYKFVYTIAGSNSTLTVTVLP
jgi:hypothetical protein